MKTTVSYPKHLLGMYRLQLRCACPVGWASSIGHTQPRGDGCRVWQAAAEF